MADKPNMSCDNCEAAAKLISTLRMVNALRTLHPNAVFVGVNSNLSTGTLVPVSIAINMLMAAEASLKSELAKLGVDPPSLTA